MKQLQIGYISAENPTNKKVWSGTHFSIFKCLQQLGNVTALGPYSPKIYLIVGKIINAISLNLFNKRFDYRHSFLLSKVYGNYFTKKINQQHFDLLVASAASCEMAFIETNIPIIYITDGTFAGCLNYHKALTNLFTFNIKQGNVIEKLALQKSKINLVSSQWAAHSILHDYSISENKIRVHPFGANFEQLPKKEEMLFTVPKIWKILFVGVYWESKGGDIAFNAFKILLDKGYEVELTILGCEPPAHIHDLKVDVIPFIDKNNSAGQSQLIEIYKSHHVLILPTRFDCTPIVINEASAFGMPCLVANTGGVRGHMFENENGFLIDYEDSGIGYAEKIENFILNPEDYLSLRNRTLNLYYQKLNWEAWRNNFDKIIKSIFE